MLWIRFSYLVRQVTRRLLTAVLAAGISTGSAWSAQSQAEQSTTPPQQVQQALPKAVLLGSAKLRFFGLPIYDANLWVEPNFDASNYATQPLVLELIYQRSFSGAEIAKRSIDEIQRQRSLTAEQARNWRLALATLLPDVLPGDSLTGLYQPQLGMQLWHGNQALGSIEDVELARLFFGIWLSTKTSEPNLRTQLLGLSP